MELTKNINPNIFREYDLRGIADEDLTEDVAYTIGRSFGSYVLKDNNYKVVVGHEPNQDSQTENNCSRTFNKTHGLTKSIT